jgi:hypothetical protein
MSTKNETLSFLFGYPVVLPVEMEETCDELPAFGMAFLEKMKSE